MVREHLLVAGIDSRGARTGATRFVQSVNRMTRAVSAFGAVYTAGRLIQTLGRYEVALVRLENVTKFAASSSEDFTSQMEDQRDAIADLTRTTVFSTGEITQAFTGLRKTGLDLEGTLDTVGDALNLAAVANKSVDESGKLVVRTLRQFNLAYSESERVVDGFVAAAALSSAEISDITEAFKFLAPIASRANLTLEQTLAVAGALIDTIGVGSIAGTGGRRLFTFLAESFEAVGFEETLRRLPDRVNSLSDAFNDFSVRGAIPAITLAREFNEVLTDQQKILQSSGLAAEQAGALTDTLTGRWKQLTNAVEGTVLAFDRATDLTGSLTAALESLQDIFEGNAVGFSPFGGIITRQDLDESARRRNAAQPTIFGIPRGFFQPATVPEAPIPPQFPFPQGPIPPLGGGLQGFSRRTAETTQFGEAIGDAIIDPLIRAAAEWDFSNFGLTVMQQINRAVLEAALDPARQLISAGVSAATAGLSAAFAPKAPGGAIPGSSGPAPDPTGILGP